MEKEDDLCLEKGAMLLNTRKAGMENVNVQKANEIILEASKGSNFYLRQQEKQQQIARKIKEMREQLDRLTDDQKTTARIRMDELASNMERTRDLSRVIVHIDMDAFYAAVEMRDDPTLTTKPMAVGCSQMLSTSNYHARQYGVRAAMPGFIAKKLCPDLVIVPLNFDKYRTVSGEVQEVLKQYDPHFCQMGLDEAYLDITHLVDTDDGQAKEEVAQRVVREMRQQIEAKTKLTASAGIAANKMLAKICSDMKKPNGQFLVPFEREEIMEFIQKTPIAKVCGIGNVTQQMLNALDVKMCGHISNRRDILPLIFSELSAESFLRISLGLGSTHVPSDDDLRKSMSIERTFKDTCDPHELKQKCSELCAALSQDLKKENIMGKTVTLKLKTITFHIKTKAKSLTCYTSAYDKINLAAQLLLDQEMKANQSLKLRLMGVRMSTLRDESEVPAIKQFTLDEFLKSGQIRDKGDTYTCPICGQTRPNLLEITKHIEECLKTDDETHLVEKEASLQQLPLNDKTVSTSSDWTCPVCNKTYRTHEGIKEFNSHIDNCLNMKTVKEVLASDRLLYERGQKRQIPTTSSENGKSRKKHVKRSSSTTIEKFLKHSTK